HVKPTVLSPGKYAIDVEPIPPRLRNNSEAHLDYLRHLKESVETIHEIVEEAKVVRPLDSSIVSACRYTKNSQELLEYAIGTWDYSRIMNFMKKFIETVRFGNDHFGAIMGYGDYVICDSVISKRSSSSFSSKHKEYLEKVAKYQRYLAGKKGSDPDSLVPKPAKATKKSKPSAPKANLRPPVTKLASSQQPKPKPAPANLKSVYDAPRGPLSPVVIREPEFGKYQPLSEVQGKGKEKVTDEQNALYLLTLPTPKKKSHVDQFIFQRSISTPTESFGHDESSSLYDELRLTDSEVESDEDVPGIDVGVQDEGQAGPNLGEQDEGQAGPNPGDATASQPQLSHVIHAGPNLKHMDLEAMDVSTQPYPKQMDEGFTETAYLNVQENLKLTVEEHVILDEPTSSTRTLYSLQHLAKDLSFGDLFFNDKPSEADNEKTTAETEAESMVSVTIQQDTSSIPPMTTPIIDLTSRHDSSNVHRPLQATATKTITTTTKTHPPPPQPQQSTTDSMLMKRIGELEQIMANLIQDNKHLEERLDSHGARLYTMENLYIPQQSMNRDHTDELLKDLAEACKKKKKRRDSPKTPLGSPPHQPPPPPPPAGPSRTSGSPGASGSSQVLLSPPPPLSTNQEGQSHGSTTPSSSKTAASAEYKAWTTTDTRIRSSYQMEEYHKLLTDSVDDSIIRRNVSKPLPLGGPPGQVTIQFDFFFNKDLEYLRYGSKGSRPALSISKMKAVYYPDVGLEQMVPDEMWIEEECKYDIASMYGSDDSVTTSLQETLLSNLSSSKAYIEGEIVSKSFKISSMRLVTQDRKAV
nr:integrase, catalytic region, zinc finger, CCHC-type, peptidase aspartic, catalytic [Tanacetum cinerariifolium]